MKRHLFHPSRRVLRGWLLGDADAMPKDGAKLDAHIATCQRCANTLEEIDAGAEDDIAHVLALVFEPPSDLSERLEQRVNARLDSRVMFGVLSDLFAAGLETSKLLMMDDPGEDDE